MTTPDSERLQRALAGWDDGPYMTFLRPSSGALIRAAGVRPGHRVLDVGSGFGDPTFDVAAAVGPLGSVVGLDHDAASVEIARRRAAERGLTNVAFEEGDVLELPFPDNTFDAVVSRNVVVYFGDPVPFLREQLRVLLPGGRSAVTTWSAGERNPLVSIPMRALQSYAPPAQPAAASPPAQGQLNTRDPHGLEQALERAGFVDTDSGTVPLTPLTRTEEAALYWEQRRAGSPASQRVLAQLSPEAQAQAEAEVIEVIRSLIAEGRATGEMTWGVGRKPSA